MTKVFLADDEIVIREGIRTSFPWSETEYQLVGEAPDGEIALSMIRDTKPDILITDIRMPFMDGLALCRVVRRQMPWIGIIILSGYDEFEYARQAIQLGVKEYMLKPITANELRQVLDRVNAQIKAEQEDRGRGGFRQSGDSANLFVKEKLLATLYSEDTTDSDALNVVSQLRSMGVALTANRYVVVDAAFEPAAIGMEVLRELAESSGGIAHVTGSRTGGRVLMLGDSDASMKSAAHIRHVLGDAAREKSLIVGVRDFGESGDGGNAHTVAARARLYLAEHFTDSNLMLGDAARAVGMSESRFSTVFAQETGKTFTVHRVCPGNRQDLHRVPDPPAPDPRKRTAGGHGQEKRPDRPGGGLQRRALFQLSVQEKPGPDAGGIPGAESN